MVRWGYQHNTFWGESQYPSRNSHYVKFQALSLIIEKIVLLDIMGKTRYVKLPKLYSCLYNQT